LKRSIILIILFNIKLLFIYLNFSFFARFLELVIMKH